MNTNDTMHGYLPRTQFADLLSVLSAQEYACAGPVLRDGAITYDRLGSADDLPRGVRVRQEPGSYRVDSGSSERLFDWANGP